LDLVNQPVKTAINQIPLLLMVGFGGGLLILSVYGMAAASVVEHLKAKALINGRSVLKSLLDGRRKEEGDASQQSN
jgi:hypothetical protein